MMKAISAGAYFVTICTHDRNCLFGEIVDGRIILNEMGEIVESEWIKSPEIRSEIELDAFQTMPNHFHAVVFIMHLNDDDFAVGATGRSPLQSNHNPSTGPRPKSLSSLIAGFKSAVITNINHFRGIPGAKLWQRNYYDRIIRDEDGLNRIREYIIYNLLKWDLDNDHLSVAALLTLNFLAKCATNSSLVIGFFAMVWSLLSLVYDG